MDFASALDWLGALPLATLVLILAALAAAENIFPPIPADVLVALGAFLAARSELSPWIPFLAVWLGNVAGAVFMMAIGRRFGAEWTERRFRLGKAGADNRVRAWHAKYGVGAFFISRFIPGVRAVVPPLAGALRVPLGGAIVAIAVASGLWYGFITWLAFRVGDDWESLSQLVTRFGRGTAIAAVAIVAVAALVWWARRRRVV